VLSLKLSLVLAAFFEPDAIFVVGVSNCRAMWCDERLAMRIVMNILQSMDWFSSIKKAASNEECGFEGNC